MLFGHLSDLGLCRNESSVTSSAMEKVLALDPASLCIKAL